MHVSSQHSLVSMYSFDSKDRILVKSWISAHSIFYIVDYLHQILSLNLNLMLANISVVIKLGYFLPFNAGHFWAVFWKGMLRYNYYYRLKTCSIKSNPNKYFKYLFICWEIHMLISFLVGVSYLEKNYLRRKWLAPLVLNSHFRWVVLFLLVNSISKQF